MRGAAAVLALVLALGGGIFLLREATQNRPDPVLDGSRTTIEFTVDTHTRRRGEEAAASALWAVCAATVSGQITPVPLAAGDDGWRVTIEPALGRHGHARVVGCLEDLTVDRVVGRVTSLRHTP